MQILSLLGSLQGGEGRANGASLLQGLGTLLAGNGADNPGTFCSKKFSINQAMSFRRGKQCCCSSPRFRSTSKHHVTNWQRRR